MDAKLANVHYDSGYLHSFDSTPLFFRHCTVAYKKATILIVHGYGEHSGRYSHIFEAMAKESFEVFAFDLRGHGHSKGDRGHIESFREFEQDLLAAISFARKTAIKSQKFFLLAHSMGALIALSLLEKHKSLIDGLIMSCPLFRMKKKVPRWQKKIGQLLSFFFPQLHLSPKIKGCQLTADKELALSYDHDPLIVRHLSIKAFHEIVRQYESSFKFSPDPKIPIFLQVAKKDPIVDTLAAISWFESRKNITLDTKLKIYPDFLHEIYNELYRKLPIGDVINWLNKRA